MTAIGLAALLQAVASNHESQFLSLFIRVEEQSAMWSHSPYFV